MPGSVLDTGDTVGRKRKDAEKVQMFPWVPCGFRKVNEDYGNSLLGPSVVWGPWYEDQ